MDKNGVKQVDLVRGLGISSGLISEYLNNLKDPGIKNVIKIANHFNCSIDWLVGNSLKLETHDPLSVIENQEYSDRYAHSSKGFTWVRVSKKDKEWLEICQGFDKEQREALKTILKT